MNREENAEQRDIREIVWVKSGTSLPLDKLHVHPGNPKVHTDEQLMHIRNSILTFGFLDPIGIWGDEAQIVEGHGRVLALRQLWEEGRIHIPDTGVPVIRLDHLTQEERDAYMLEHNQATMETPWDDALLHELLDGLEGVIDMEELFGFESVVDVIEPEEEKPLEITYQLIIECGGEEEMRMNYDKLQELGFDCKAVMKG